MIENRNDAKPRGEAPRAPPRRPDPRPAGTLPTFDGAENQVPRYGNPPGSGASRTGFVSTNIRRRLTTDKRPTRRPAPKLGSAPAGTSGTPISLGASGASTTLPRTTGATASTDPSATPVTPAAAPPRNPLLR